MLGSCKDKHRLISDLKSKVNDFLEDNPNATLYTIENHFGTAQSIAEEFNSSLTVEEIKGEKTKTILKYIICALLIAALVAVIIMVCIIISDGSRNNTIYIEQSISDYGITEVVG